MHLDQGRHNCLQVVSELLLLAQSLKVSGSWQDTGETNPCWSFCPPSPRILLTRRTAFWAEHCQHGPEQRDRLNRTACKRRPLKMRRHPSNMTRTKCHGSQQCWAALTPAASQVPLLTVPMRFHRAASGRFWNATSLRRSQSLISHTDLCRRVRTGGRARDMRAALPCGCHGALAAP